MEELACNSVNDDVGDNSFLDVELEALQSIYINEIEIHKKDKNCTYVSINLHPATADNLDEKYVRMTLKFTLCDQYPEKLPGISIGNPRGLSEEKLNSVMEDLLSIAESKKGNSMLFEIIEAAKEHLTAENRPSEECAICLYGFSDDDVFTKTECYHYFHSHCLARYAKSILERREESDVKSKEVRNELLCPVCRIPIHFEGSEELYPPPIAVCEDTFTVSEKILEMQKEMADLYQRQLEKGGIIDLEAEKNKYLLEISNVPTRVNENSKSSAIEKNSDETNQKVEECEISDSVAVKQKVQPVKDKSQRLDLKSNKNPSRYSEEKKSYRYDHRYAKDANFNKNSKKHDCSSCDEHYGNSKNHVDDTEESADDKNEHIEDFYKNEETQPAASDFDSQPIAGNSGNLWSDSIPEASGSEKFVDKAKNFNSYRKQHDGDYNKSNYLPKNTPRYRNNSRWTNAPNGYNKSNFRDHYNHQSSQRHNRPAGDNGYYSTDSGFRGSGKTSTQTHSSETVNKVNHYEKQNKEAELKNIRQGDLGTLNDEDSGKTKERDNSRMNQYVGVKYNRRSHFQEERTSYSQRKSGFSHERENSPGRDMHGPSNGSKYSQDNSVKYENNYNERNRGNFRRNNRYSRGYDRRTYNYSQDAYNFRRDKYANKKGSEYEQYSPRYEKEQNFSNRNRRENTLKNVSDSQFSTEMQSKKTSCATDYVAEMPKCEFNTHDDSYPCGTESVVDGNECPVKNSQRVLAPPPGFANPLKKVIYGLHSANPPPGFQKR